MTTFLLIVILNYTCVTHSWHFCHWINTKGLCYDSHSIIISIFKSIHVAAYPVGVTTIPTCNFWKSHITLLFFIHLQQILNCKCTLIIILQPPNFKKSIHNFFSKLCRKKRILKKNTKNIRWILKAHISMMTGQIHLKFEMGNAKSWGNIYVCFHLGIIKL